MRFRLILLLLLLCSIGTLQARGIYQEPSAFLKDTFSGKVPEPRVIWLTADIQKTIARILGHQLEVMRIRYWRGGKRTAWILEEIGKEEPITVGIVINGNKIERIKVLVYRESRGWEVRYPFFTKQFKQRGLKPDLGLDGHIDGITGATLSVNALKKLARLALFLHKQVMAQ